MKGIGYTCRKGPINKGVLSTSIAPNICEN